MKQISFIIALILAAAPGALAGEVKPGDTLQQVVAALGEPRGEIAAGDYRLLYYERGKVELRGGKVVKTELVSEAQAEKTRLLREKQAAEAQRASEEARAQRIVDGTALRKAKLADTAFLASPASERVRFWQDFKRQYPEVALGDEYAAALKALNQQYAAQQVDRAQQAQIEALEQRVADAESRAQRAESRGTSVYYGYDSPVIYANGWAHPSPWSYHRACGIVPPSIPFYVPATRGYVSKMGVTPISSSKIGINTYAPWNKAATAPGGLSVQCQGGNVNVTVGGR